MPRLNGDTWNYFWEEATMKIPEKMKPVESVSE
jgi:hypothetical protein